MRKILNFQTLCIIGDAAISGIANHIRLQPHRHGLVPGPYVVSRPSQRLLRTFTRVRARQHPVLHPETRSATTDFYIRQRTEINTHSRLLVHLRQYDLYLSLAIQTINLSRCVISHYSPAPGLYTWRWVGRLQVGSVRINLRRSDRICLFEYSGLLFGTSKLKYIRVMRKNGRGKIGNQPFEHRTCLFWKFLWQ